MYALSSLLFLAVLILLLLSNYRTEAQKEMLTNLQKEPVAMKTFVLASGMPTLLLCRSYLCRL